MVNAIDYEK